VGGRWKLGTVARCPDLRPPLILISMKKEVDEMRTTTSNALVSVDARWKPC
jgi:hypothetical protein